MGAIAAESTSTSQVEAEGSDPAQPAGSGWAFLTVMGLLVSSLAVLVTAGDPTATQWLYLEVALVGAPLVGLGAVRHADTPSRGEKHSLAMAAATLAGLVLGGAFALVVFPDYGWRSPHEAVAMLTVLPAATLPGWYLRRITTSASAIRGLRRWITGVFVGLVILVGAVVGDRTTFCAPLTPIVRETTRQIDLAGLYEISWVIEGDERTASRSARCMGLDEEPAGTDLMGEPTQVWRGKTYYCSRSVVYSSGRISALMACGPGYGTQSSGSDP